jgi:hypothetical protein
MPLLGLAAIRLPAPAALPPIVAPGEVTKLTPVPLPSALGLGRSDRAIGVAVVVTSAVGPLVAVAVAVAVAVGPSAPAWRSASRARPPSRRR